MYSNKLEGPRRGRSFDSMNIGIEEKLLNNEVRKKKETKFIFIFSVFENISTGTGFI